MGYKQKTPLEILAESEKAKRDMYNKKQAEEEKQKEVQNKYDSSFGETNIYDSKYGYAKEGDIVPMYTAGIDHYPHYNPFSKEEAFYNPEKEEKIKDKASELDSRFIPFNQYKDKRNYSKSDFDGELRRIQQAQYKEAIDQLKGFYTSSTSAKYSDVVGNVWATESYLSNEPIEAKVKSQVEEEVNDEEECIINIQELADHYTKSELQLLNIDITSTEYAKEYNIILEKHINIIKQFKRSKNV